MFLAIPVLMLAACKKEVIPDNMNQALSNKISALKSNGKKVTVPIANNLQSDPDPNPTSPYGGAIFYGTMTHLGNVHGRVVNTSFTPITANVFAITSDDIGYAANGDELWTKGDIVITYPTDASTTATITGGSKIVGGTGRFAGATGYFIYENMVYDIVTGHESHTAHGEITY